MMRRFWLHLKNNHLIILLGVLFFAGIMRFWQINAIPNGLYWDEAAITYDAWGISIDGKDQWGTAFPLIFTSFGDGKLPFTEYALALLFRIGGFHVEWLRYLAASFGVLLVWGTYSLAKKLFPHPSPVPLLTAFLIASSSWAIHFSRFGLEAAIGTTMMVWSTYFLYQSNKRLNDFIGIILLVFSAYTYHGNLLIAPFILFLIGWKKLRTIFFLILMIPLVLSLTKSSWTRASQTLFWAEPGFTFSTQSIVTEIVRRVGNQVSPSFWIMGNQVNLRQAVPDFFVVFPIELLFIVIGLIGISTQSQKRGRFLWLWLCIGIIPSLIGNPSPHTIRSYNILPIIKIIEACGIYWIYKRSRIIALIVSCVYLLHFAIFWQHYTTQYAFDSAADYQYGYKELMNSLEKEGNSWKDSFVISPVYGQPYIYTLLYWKISPPEYRSGGLANVSFRLINWPEPSEQSFLYAGSPQEIPPTDSRVVGQIYYPGTTIPIWVIAR